MWDDVWGGLPSSFQQDMSCIIPEQVDGRDDDGGPRMELM